MKANEQIWTAILDPRYSVLALPHGLGRVGARYLDIATGWQGSRRNRRFRAALASTSAEVTSSGNYVKSSGASR